jgi:cytochrome c-type biogenesis protein CcmH
LTVIPYAVFALIALAAVAFAAAPLMRAKTGKGRWLLVGAIALFMLGIGGGTYWMLGEPELALRETVPPQKRDLKGLIPMLVARVRQTPEDATGWTYLGRAYMTLRDPGDAAKAFSRAVALLRARRQNVPEIFSAYGEALVAQDGGAVGPEAEAAFTAALAGDPRDPAGRYYLGMARAGHGDKAGAMALWQSLAADVPPTSPLHQVLVDRIAMLTAQNGMAGGSGGAPDPRRMVAGLAARLKADPNDAAGWQRLIRAYTVLGEPDKAKDALATARKTFASNKDALTTFGEEAKELKLE